MAKALTRLEAEEYLVRYVTAGYEAMLQALPDSELVQLFQSTTGQALILPAHRGDLTDAQGNPIARAQDTGAAEGTGEDEGA